MLTIFFTLYCALLLHESFVTCYYVRVLFDSQYKMADTEDIQPLVCDNGTGMVKVSNKMRLFFLLQELWH